MLFYEACTALPCKFRSALVELLVMSLERRSKGWLAGSGLVAFSGVLFAEAAAPP